MMINIPIYFPFKYSMSSEKSNIHEADLTVSVGN